MKSKSPVYAALDLHSRHSVLGSMEHGGKTGARMRFPTEANNLRAQVERLRRRRRPLYLTMEAGALTRWASAIVRPLVEQFCSANWPQTFFTSFAFTIPSTNLLFPACL